MGQKNKYRIVEFDEMFTIQIRTYETNGCLWWKRRIKVWKRTNLWGHPLNHYPIPAPKSPEYFSLKEAKKQVKLWKKGRIIHKLKKY